MFHLGKNPKPPGHPIWEVATRLSLYEMIRKTADDALSHVAYGSSVEIRALMRNLSSCYTIAQGLEKSLAIEDRAELQKMVMSLPHHIISLEYASVLLEHASENIAAAFRVAQDATTLAREKGVPDEEIRKRYGRISQETLDGLMSTTVGKSHRPDEYLAYIKLFRPKDPESD